MNRETLSSRMTETSRSKTLLAKVVTSVWLVCLVLGLAGAKRLEAQVYATGTILGRVVDPSGASIPAANVTVMNVATGVKHSMKTNADGLYTFSSLIVGSYSVEVAKQGFKTSVVANILLNAGARYTADVELQVGIVSTRVTVSAVPPLLESQTNTVSQVIGSQTVLEMPLNGRNFQQLQLLTPGVLPGTFSTGPEVGTENNSVNGVRQIGNAYIMDGADITDQAFNGVEFVPPVDAIQEFRMITSNQSAKYGYGPNTTLVAIKSGTNQVHGEAWDFVRNTSFDARNFFELPNRGVLQRNQFGGTIGGPIIKNHLFFFGTYEGVRQSSTSPAFYTVPTLAERNGSFASVLGGQVGMDALGRPVYANEIFNPLTSRNVTAGQVDPTTGLVAVSTGIIRDPFPGNAIPSNQINPAVPVLLSFIPPPNAPGVVNNFATTPLATDNTNVEMVRVDYTLSAKDQFTFTGGIYRGNPVSAGPYSTSTASPYLATEGEVVENLPTQNGVLGWTHTISPTTLLDMHLSSSWKTGIFSSPTTEPGGLDLYSKLGILGGLPYHAATPGIPDVSITGFTGTAGLSLFPTGWRYNQSLWSTNMTMLRGKHDLYFGYALRWWKGGLYATGDHRGNWTFNGEFTDSPSVSPVADNALADFMLGFPYNASRTAPWGWFYYTMKNQWLYAGDSYKIRPHLTLNYGLRYEYDPYPVEEYHQVATWLPQGRGGEGVIVIPAEKYVEPPYSGLHTTTTAQMQLFNSLGIVETASQAGIPESLRFMPKKDFAPRVGFAWEPWNDTVIRGGFGIYFIPADLNNNLGNSVQPPFVDRTTPFLNTYPTPLYDMQNDYCRQFTPTYLGQCIPGSPFSFPSQPGLVVAQVNEANGYVQQWNFDVQHRFLRNWLVDIGYVGSGGIHLEGERQLNTPPPGLGNIQARRPFPDFGTINLDETSRSSRYDSLQIKAQREFSHGMSILSSFTYSRSIDDASTAFEGLINPYFPQLNWAASDFDAPLNFVTSYIWDMPIHKSGAIRWLTNGWELSGIFSAQSGYPYTVGWAGDPMNVGEGTVPDRVCSGKVANPTPQDWFNLSCFVSPPVLPGTGGLVTSWGNSGRNILREDRIISFDPGIYKNFQFSERFRAQFRVEAFNVTNAVSFGQPGNAGYGWGTSFSTNANVSASNQVLSAAAPRIIQLALKFYF